MVHSLFKEYYSCARSFSLLLLPALSLSRLAVRRLKKPLPLTLLLLTPLLLRLLTPLPLRLPTPLPRPPLTNLSDIIRTLGSDEGRAVPEGAALFRCPARHGVPNVGAI